MVYIFNQKQQKQYQVLLRTRKQLLESMPTGKERYEILRKMYKESYLPLFKNACVKASLVHAAEMNSIVSYYYRGDFSKPFILFNPEGKIVATEHAITFHWGNVPYIEYNLKTSIVEPTTITAPKWFVDMGKMVQALGTPDSCVDIDAADRFCILRSNYSFFSKYMTEGAFVKGDDDD